MTSWKNEVDSNEIEGFEVGDGVDLRVQHGKEDEHDFGVVQEANEHELQHD